MAQAQMVGFRLVKGGGEIDEWEDWFAYDTGDPRAGTARCAVADGASEGFDSQRWARQLAEGFLKLPASVLGAPHGAGFLDWVRRLQQLWEGDAAALTLNPYEEIKLRQGSMATFLGCWINGLCGPEPTWNAIAFGDVVLFHIRDGQVEETFPDLSPAQFGIDPIGVFTLPQMLPRMQAGVILTDAPRRLLVGDVMYLASDALAEWLVRARPAEPWAFLADFDDTHVFAHFVLSGRAAGKLKNDDVTLLRVEITEGDPEFLVVSR